MIDTTIDLFSGAGGLSTGFEEAGFETVVALDNKKEAVDTFEQNHPKTKVFLKDIRKVNVNDILEKAGVKKEYIQVIIGGPPCEGFSTVGYRREKDPRNSLFNQFAKFIDEIRPKAFLMENVTGLLSMSGGEVFKNVIDTFENLGYEVKHDTLNAADYGVPQNRDRVFIVGTINKNTYKFPNKKYKEKSSQQKLINDDKKYYITVKEAISDLPSLKPGEGGEISNYTKDPETPYQKERRKNSKKLYNHAAPNHTKKVITRIKNIPEWGTHADLPKKLQLKSGFPNIYGRLAWNKPADTITGNCGCVSAPGRFIHPSDNRVITVREAARLQSFDDSYRFFGNRTNKYKLVGDSVPPLLAKELAIEMRGLI